VEIVRRWFTTYIQLRDGFVLMESSERWHNHNNDGDESFSSRLKGAVCSDGYTCKFKLERGYTGRAYDEAFDPQVGIRVHHVSSHNVRTVAPCYGELLALLVIPTWLLHVGPGFKTCLVPRFFGRIYYVRH
jgi:hypothetical protein